MARITKVKATDYIHPELTITFKEGAIVPDRSGFPPQDVEILYVENEYGNEEGPFLKLGDDLFEATSLQWRKIKLKDDGERDYSQLDDDEEQSTLTVFAYLQAMQEYGGGVKEMKFKEGRPRALFGD